MKDLWKRLLKATASVPCHGRVMQVMGRHTDFLFISSTVSVGLYFSAHPYGVMELVCAPAGVLCFLTVLHRMLRGAGKSLPAVDREAGALDSDVRKTHLNHNQYVASIWVMPGQPFCGRSLTTNQL